MFPQYDQPSSALIRMYLGGEFGTHPQDVSPYAASAFYAVDRYASWRKVWGEDYQNGRLILADRYTTSNAVHQASKLLPGERKAFLDWLFDTEYRLLGLPKPDLVIYLDMDPNTSRRLLEKRYGGDESRKDLHEANLLYLLSCRGAALYAAEHWGWKVIRCCDGSDPYPPEQIHQAVLAEAEAWLRRQHPAESDGF